MALVRGILLELGASLTGLSSRLSPLRDSWVLFWETLLSSRKSMVFHVLLQSLITPSPQRGCVLTDFGQQD